MAARRIANLHVADQRPVFVHDGRNRPLFLQAQLVSVIDQPDFVVVQRADDFGCVGHRVHGPVGHVLLGHGFDHEQATMAFRLRRDVIEVLQVGIDAAMAILARRHRTGADIDRMEITFEDVIEGQIGGLAELVLTTRLCAQPCRALFLSINTAFIQAAYL